jgi:hypothetical protein
MPSVCIRIVSTLEAQAAQVMPVTGKVCLLILDRAEFMA